MTLDLSLDSGVSSAPTLANLNPLAEQEEKKRELSRKIMIGAVVAAGLMVAVGLAIVLIKILNI